MTWLAWASVAVGIMAAVGLAAWAFARAAARPAPHDAPGAPAADLDVSGAHLQCERCGTPVKLLQQRDGILLQQPCGHEYPLPQWATATRSCCNSPATGPHDSSCRYAPSPTGSRDRTRRGKARRRARRQED